MSRGLVEPLAAAAEALESAEEGLKGLPMTPEVEGLHRRFLSARTVLHGVIVEGIPSVTESQRQQLLALAEQLADDVAAVRRSRDD